MSESIQQPDPSAQNLLLEEYKIIQDKIDKLGEDKFKVRSWCFTLLTGGIAVTKFSGASETLWVGPWIFLLFVPAIAAFQLVESRQRQIGKRLGSRAQAIEQIWLRQSGKGGTAKDTPRLASHLIREAQAERSVFSFSLWHDRVFYPELTNREKEGARVRSKTRSKTDLAAFKEFLIVNADNAFYWTQYVLVLVFVGILLPQYYLAGTQQPPPPAIVVRVGTNEIQFSEAPTNLEIGPAAVDIQIDGAKTNNVRTSTKR